MTGPRTTKPLFFHIVITSFLSLSYAFSIAGRSSSSYPPSSLLSSVLFGRRGGLAREFGDLKNEDETEWARTTKGKKKEGRKMKKKSSGAVSSSLTEWVKSSTESTPKSPTSAIPYIEERSDSSTDPSDSFTSFATPGRNETKKRSAKQRNSRRERQASRLVEERMLQSEADKAVEKLRKLFGDDDEKKKKKGEKNNGNSNVNVESVIECVKTLSSVSEKKDGGASSSFRSILSPQNVKGFSLGWAGSDEAICRIGTGLHNVPLARLQEMYLTLDGDGERFDGGVSAARVWKIYEVIRIIGPFPNVRNTLRGEITDISKYRSSNRNSGYKYEGGGVVSIAYDSLVDGVGKEVLAGTDANIRKVNVMVLYADESALVFCALPNDENRDNIQGKEYLNDTMSLLGPKGENILLFLGVDNVDEKLERLRVR